jgi:hypothetical protein
MDLLKQVYKTKNFKQLYDVPFQNTNENTIIKRSKILLCANICYGFGDAVFLLKVYNYIKEWYNIEAEVLSSTPDYFIKNGVKKVYGAKTPGKNYEECALIKNMKMYNVDSKGKFLTRVSSKNTPVYDIILVTPWISDQIPDRNALKGIFPYSNRFNTFFFSSYNPPSPHLYDFPTGIGKNYYGILLTEPEVLPRNKDTPYPYLMVHLSYYHSVNINGCFDKFIKLMCKKYYKKHNRLDVIMPKLILEDEKAVTKLIKKIKEDGYYQEVEIIKEKGLEKTYDKNTSVLRLRTELLPLPYAEYVNLFNYSLPDVLTTGNQSVTDIVSCCKNYNIYYQLMPWERPFARGLNNALRAPKDYLKNVKTSCGMENMSIDKQMNLRLIEEKNDFRVLGKAKLDKIINNAHKLRTDKDTIKFIDIVLSSRKRSTVIEKFKKYLKEI